MIGVLITLLFALCMEGFGRALYGRWMGSLDLAAKTGIAGILGLGTCGLLTLFIGLLPNGLVWGIGVVALFALIGPIQLIRDKFWKESIFPRKPVGLEWLFVLAVFICGIFALVAVLTPSNALDWDTIAYHLAVPKLWLQAGHIYPIVYIHHSNFPESVDNLYIWGIFWGGQFGAKAFQLSFFIFGVLAIFGLTRQRYGGRAGSWAALTFATVPAILWEAGTGYIDVAHGLFTGLGVVLTVMSIEQLLGSQSTIDNRQSTIPPLWPIAALCLGFAAGSKYTGLQAFIAVAVIVGGYLLIKAKGRGLGQLAAILGVAVAVCSPWYIKNIFWTGNPVYPFFYEQFGGKYWAKPNADIYREQQQIFGVPRTGPAAGLLTLPDAVMGLAFQPSRYTDPNPKLDKHELSGATLVTAKIEPQPTGAQGFWFGAIGAAVLAAGFVWCFSGRLKRFEGLILGFVGFSFLMWFVLSQQSRYAISFVPILALLLGAGVVRLRAGPVLAVVAAVQSVASIFIYYSYQFQGQVQVATGKISQEEYLARTLSPYRAFQWLNQNVKGGRVALYDEVFGFYLDVPYFWANPGHCTVIGYDQLNSGEQFVARLKQMGFTHIYLARTDDHWDAVLSTLGFGEQTTLPPQIADEFKNDWQRKYKFLICDAAAKGLITLAPIYDKNGDPEIAKRAPGFILEIK